MTALRPDQVPGLAFVEVPAQDPRSRQLIAEVQAVYVGLYGGQDDSPVTASEFVPPSGTFLVARNADAEPIGCIAVRHHAEHVGEIKRMYVRPEHRRRGYGLALLLAAEHRACELGYTALVLETGAPHPEAIALYEGHGYRPIPAFGYYEGAPQSQFFRREL